MKDARASNPSNRNQILYCMRTYKCRLNRRLTAMIKPIKPAISMLHIRNIWCIVDTYYRAAGIFFCIEKTNNFKKI